MRLKTTDGTHRERRTVGFEFEDLELREPRGEKATGDGSLTFSGLAAVYGARTVLGEIPGVIRVTEELAPGALTGILAREPDVHFNHGHDMSKAMARVVYGAGIGEVPTGGMRLTEDETGLRVFARLDPEDPDVHALAVKMRRGIIDEMSFAFRIGDEEITEREDEDGTLVVDYTIREVSDLIDVCACARGAYSQTHGEIRSMLSREMDRVSSHRKRHSASDEEGAISRHPEGGEGQPSRTPGGSILRAKLVAARSKYPLPKR